MDKVTITYRPFQSRRGPMRFATVMRWCIDLNDQEIVAWSADADISDADIRQQLASDTQSIFDTAAKRGISIDMSHDDLYRAIHMAPVFRPASNVAP